MAKTRTGKYELKPRDFAGHAHISPGYISNGHWIVRRAAVANEALYRTEEGTAAVLGDNVQQVKAYADDAAMVARAWLKPDARVLPFVVTRLLYDAPDKNKWRLLAGPAGKGTAEIQEKYADVFGVTPGDTLHAADQDSAMWDAATADMATWGIMVGRAKGRDSELDVLQTARTSEVQEGGDNASDEA